MASCLSNIFDCFGEADQNGSTTGKEYLGGSKASMTSSTLTSMGGRSSRKSSMAKPGQKTMQSITIYPTKQKPRRWRQKGVASSDEFFMGTAPDKYKESEKILQGTFKGYDFDEDTICASTNGLVRSAAFAYSNHHHLTLRPEDIWFAILTQIGFHINAHAEELRDHFVDHDGRKELEVVRVGSIETVDIGEMSLEMTDLIQANVKDRDLQRWIMPAFSTTTEEDTVVAAVLMMGAMQKYFAYTYTMCCGIPSVTLLGTRADWEEMLHRLKKLAELGDEPTLFYAILKPVLSFFVRSFDAPQDPQVLDFWSKIAHEQGGSGPDYLSGWITAFCFWDADGKRMYHDPVQLAEMNKIEVNDEPSYDLDVALHAHVNSDILPAGFAVVDAKVNDNGKKYMTKLIAGSVGIRATSSGEELDEVPIYGLRKDESSRSKGGPGLDSIQPVTGWWMYKLREELQPKM
ncbi:MAG: hypothetical protein M1821_003957 [Bathelium mastoideum]|nr:MAG: hypothetical protein M1821_003957 [Bathelium mastoideum]